MSNTRKESINRIASLYVVKTAGVSLKDFAKLDDPKKFITKALKELIPAVEEQIEANKKLKGSSIRLEVVADYMSDLSVFMQNVNKDESDPVLNSQLKALTDSLDKSGQYFKRMTQNWDWSPDTSRKANKVVKELEVILKILKG